MTDQAANKKKKLFVTLDDQAYKEAPAPSPEAVRDALAKGSADLSLASAQPRSVKIDPKRRFR